MNLLRPAFARCSTIHAFTTAPRIGDRKVVGVIHVYRLEYHKLDE